MKQQDRVLRRNPDGTPYMVQHYYGDTGNSAGVTYHPMTPEATPTKRQFCSRCGQTTSDYATHEHDQRTPAEKQAGRAPIIRRFHVCADCMAWSRP
jgi:ribosomal protein S27AE